MKSKLKTLLSVGEKVIILAVLYVAGSAAMWLMPSDIKVIIGGVIAVAWLALWGFFVFNSGFAFAAVEILWWLTCLLDVLFPLNTSTDGFPFMLELFLLGPAICFGRSTFPHPAYPIVCAVMLLVGAAGIIYRAVKTKKEKPAAAE